MKEVFIKEFLEHGVDT